jgi:uncharacterized SAM-binding protein YcdF (DUF218 family)
MIYLLKFFYSWLLPPGLFVLLLLGLAWWCRRRSRGTSVALLFVTALIYACSVQPVSERLLQDLEYRYAPAEVAGSDVIILLGGGTVSNVPVLPEWSGQLSDASVQRLLPAYVLHRRTGLPILTSGGEVFSEEGYEARYMKDVLISQGMAADKILVEDRSLNTTENARFTAEILKARGFSRPLLVTSAFHMPRAVKNFEQAGVKVLPYPVGFYSSRTYQGNLLSWAPSYSALRGTGLALKEYMGLAALSVGR